MEVRTILWPTDLSRNSLKAAPHVNSLAEKYQAKVLVLYVGVDLMNLLPYGGKYPNEEYLEHFRNWETEQAKKRLETICDKELKACPMFDVVLVTGDPATEILKAVFTAVDLFQYGNKIEDDMTLMVVKVVDKT